MDSKFEVNRLDKYELTYELAFRGYNENLTLKDMRKSLRNYLKLEKSESTMKYPKYPFTFDEDMNYVTNKIMELKTLISDFTDTANSASCLKISSKLVHTFRRLKRVVSKSDDEHSKRAQLLVDILALESNLKLKVRKYMKLSQQSEVPVDLSIAISSSRLHSSSESSESEEESKSVADAAINNCSCVNFKGIAISKWNLTKFDGDTRL